MTSRDLDTALAILLAADFASPLERARHAMRHGKSAEVRTFYRLEVLRLEREAKWGAS